MRTVTLVAGTEQTRQALVNQVKEYLSDIVMMKSYAIDEGIEEIIRDQLVILSSYLVRDELIASNLLDTSCEIIIANRTVNYDHIDEVVFLHPGTEVLFVNDVPQTTYEGIAELQKIGLDHIQLIPYYPGIKTSKRVKIAVTPGEVDKVPDHIQKVYDIGPRTMDFATITKILNRLDILDHKAGQFSQRYLKKMINMAKRIAQSTNEISDLNQHLNLVLDSLNDGLLVYDVNGFISICNENLRRILSISCLEVIRKSVKDVIYNKSLLEFLMDQNTTEEKMFESNGQEMLVNKFKLSEDHTMIATFKRIGESIKINEKIRRELVNKGFYAKYTLDDIIGSSVKIERVKEVSQKLARTDLTILIEGESGTGKELFASAIHHASRRRGGPFLAVNFSALPDELIESELFGYEEGAFTGAKKGGKPGLFEQADRGTIFLDEIGDISPKVQARLLRILQEKELMRIGGNEIKPINVRVIAATNKDLAKLVNDKKFREDLYYRLKMGYLKLPPIRERKEDIIALMNYFIKTETTEDIKLDHQVIEALLKYNWYGNVRELKNTLSYMLAVRDSNNLTLKDIPDKGFFQQNQEEKRVMKDMAYLSDITNEQGFLLRAIHKLEKMDGIVGRESLAEFTRGTKYEMTKYQVRNRLDHLEKQGLIVKKKGKHGTMLSEKGKEVLMAEMI